MTKKPTNQKPAGGKDEKQLNNGATNPTPCGKAAKQSKETKPKTTGKTGTAGATNPQSHRGKGNDPVFYGHNVPEGLVGVDTARRIRTNPVDVSGCKISSGWHTKILTIMNPGVDTDKNIRVVFNDDYRYLRTHVKGARYYNQNSYGAYQLNMLTAFGLVCTMARNFAVAMLASSKDRADKDEVMAAICLGSTEGSVSRDAWLSLDARNKLLTMAAKFDNLPAAKCLELGKVAAMYSNIFAVVQNEVATFRAFSPAVYFLYTADGVADGIATEATMIDGSDPAAYLAALKKIYEKCASFATAAGFLEIMQGDVISVFKSLAKWDFTGAAQPGFGVAEWTLTQWRWMNLNTALRETIGDAGNYGVDLDGMSVLVKNAVAPRRMDRGQPIFLPGRKVSPEAIREIISWTAVSGNETSTSNPGDVYIQAVTSNVPVKVELIRRVNLDGTYTAYSLAKLLRDTSSMSQDTDTKAVAALCKAMRYDPTFPILPLNSGATGIEGEDLEYANPSCVPTEMDRDELIEQIGLANRSTYSLIKPPEDEK